ncbi:hypothetical protein IAG44_17670 [Streptomyces roseirectus]|uniref:HPr kinase n=1 Tax=Streptomyces roseirectus TaxID=2768066 RepID=A0A7H0IE69_9ACTN|nr:hypothetical protein [Streptomyces roseirectus]QNP71085.1 hypothetical protein IAG44_17670 [Streptomyces roseirectus]
MTGEPRTNLLDDPVVPVVSPPGEVFTLSRWFARLSVESALPELNAFLTALLGPYFVPAAGADPDAVTVSVRCVPELPGTRGDLEAVPRSPQLWLDEDGPRMVVLEHLSDTMVTLRDMEEDSDPVLISVHRGERAVRLDIAEDTPRARRGVVRLVAFLLSAQLHSGGVPVLHGSAVARDGKAVAVFGASSSGKSTLAFLASTLAGWDFVSDDTLLAWETSPGGPLALSGAPRRLGIGVGALVGHPARERFETHPLRRYGDSPLGSLPTPSTHSWSREGRVRIYCDIDEFTAITGTRCAQHAEPAGIVLPVADPHMSGWTVEADTSGTAAPELEPTSGRGLRYFVDYLGILAPRPFDAQARARVLEGVRQLPRVRVRYGPDVNKDFPRFWDEVTGALGLGAGVGEGASC